MPFSKTGLSLASAATARVKSKVAMVTRFMFGPFKERVGPFHTEGLELGARTRLSEDKGEGGGLKIPSPNLLKKKTDKMTLRVAAEGGRVTARLLLVRGLL